MIYADHAASAPALPEVVAAVAAALGAGLGNPSAQHHAPGRAARGLIDDARAAVAALIGARPDELAFTSGATEACNLAIMGVVHRLAAVGRPRILAVATEHAAVLGPLAALGGTAEVELLPVGADGRLDPALVAARIDSRTGLVCAMLVNNETGVIHDLPVLADIAHRAGALLFTDASQAPLRIPVDLPSLGADLAALSGHKVHGPPGIGALWRRRGLGLDPLLHGGGQERGLRPGTENAPALAGWAAAARLVDAAVRVRIADLGARLEAALQEIPGVRIHGATAPRAPGILMLTVPAVGAPLLPLVPEIAASAGASCAQGRPSHVLEALGIAPAEARTALRLSLGATSTVADVDGMATAVGRAVARGAGRSAGG